MAKRGQRCNVHLLEETGDDIGTVVGIFLVCSETLDVKDFNDLVRSRWAKLRASETAKFQQ